MAKKTSTSAQRKEIAKAFYINGDEKLLLKKIKEGDKVALVQLAMLYMRFIISCAQRERFEGQPITTLVDAATHGFIVAAEKAANENIEVIDGLHRQMHLAINEAVKHLPEKNHRCIKYDTPKHIAYLNRLNRLLKEKEALIVLRVTEYLGQVKQKIDSEDVFTNDYELEVEVQYYIKGGGDPSHVYHDHFRYERADEDIFGLLCSSEDWWESYMPVLDEPYCYLLHDLIDHSRLGSKLFSIATIWIDIRLTDQHCIRL